MVNVQGWLGKGSPEGRSFQAACRELDRARCAPTDQTARGGGESATPGKTTGERVGRTGKSRTDPTAAGRCFRRLLRPLLSARSSKFLLILRRKEKMAAPFVQLRRLAFYAQAAHSESQWNAPRLG